MSDPDHGLHPRSRDLSAYLDGGLSGRRADEVRVHLASCERCREETETLRVAKAVIADLPQADPQPDWLPRMRENLAGDGGGQPHGPNPRRVQDRYDRRVRWGRRARRGLRLAGVVTGLAAAALWVVAWLAPPPQTPVSFQDEVRQHMVQIDEPLADLTSYVVEAHYP